LAVQKPPEGCHGQSVLAAVEKPIEGREFLFSRIGNFAGMRNTSHRLTMNLKDETPCELFNMNNDPGELVNLVNENASKDLVNDLGARLKAHLTD